MYTERLEWKFVPGSPQYEETTRRRASNCFGVTDTEAVLHPDGVDDEFHPSLLQALNEQADDVSAIATFENSNTGDLYTVIVHETQFHRLQSDQAGRWRIRVASDEITIPFTNTSDTQ